MGNGDSTAVTAEDMNTELTNQGASANGDNPISVTFENGNKYTIDSKGNIGGYVPPKFQADYTTGKILVEGKDIGLEIGDVIQGYDALDGATKYTETSNATENGMSDQVFRIKEGDNDDEKTLSYDLSLGWKVLGTDSKGSLMITTSDVVFPVSYGNTTTGSLKYKLGYAKGVKNGIEELNKLCALYGQGALAIDSRSMNIEDINNITNRNANDIDGNGTAFTQRRVLPFGTEITFSWEEDGGSFPYISYVSSTGTPIHRKLTKAYTRFYFFDETSKNMVESLPNDSLGIINNNPIKCTYYTYTKENAGGTDKAKNMIFLEQSYILSSNYFVFFSGTSYDYGAYGYLYGSNTGIYAKSIFSTYDGGSDRDVATRRN